MKTRVPVGLSVGDGLVTTWGNLRILDVDVDRYHVKDVNTGEETWFHHDDLVEIMVGSMDRD